jgi:hypothetical protein
MLMQNRRFVKRMAAHNQDKAYVVMIVLHHLSSLFWELGRAGIMPGYERQGKSSRRWQVSIVTL